MKISTRERSVSGPIGDRPTTSPPPAALVARIFKGLGDPTRVRILRVLVTGEKSVTELVHLLGTPQARVSTHLGYLRSCGIVTSYRRGKSVYYLLANTRIGALVRVGDRLGADRPAAFVPTNRPQEVLVTYVIGAPCIDVMDKSCIDVCPVDCIHFEEGADRMLYINPDECIDCGACEPACPVKAIYPEDALPEEMDVFKTINAQWYADPDAARAAVQHLKSTG
jgi:ferredoxin